MKKSSICKVFLLFLLMFSTGFFFCRAEDYAVIISGKSGNEELYRKNSALVSETLKTLALKGFKKENISVFSEKPSSSGEQASDLAKVGESLERLAQQLKDDDCLFVLISGHASATRSGLSLILGKGILKEKQLAAMLSAIKGKKTIFCFNTLSAPLMKSLSDSKNTVLTATSSPGQGNPPLFPEFFIREWTSAKDYVDLKTIVRKAADATFEYYNSRSLAIVESPQLATASEIIKFPPGKTDITALTTTTKDDTVSSGKKPRPADSATIDEKITAALKNAPALAEKYSTYDSFFISKDIDLVFDGNGSFSSAEDNIIYINKDSATEKFGTMTFGNSPHSAKRELVSAEIFRPDGSSEKVKPVISGKPGERISFVKFKGICQGSVIRLKLRSIENSRSGSETGYGGEFYLQEKEPVESVIISLSCPLNKKVNYAFYNMNKPESSTEKGPYSNKTIFRTGPLEAFEALPFDPPSPEIMAFMRVTSFESWKEFRELNSKLMDGSDICGEKTKETFNALTEGKKSAPEKLRAIYEYLCELRYDTTPIGIRALRPRLPDSVCESRYGDCKDKANALVAMAYLAGIKGYVALLNRFSSTDVSFPAWQFNHAVAFFPELEGFPDGLWCDATDGSTPFSTLPPGDIGRDAMLLKPDSGYEFRKIALPGKNVNSMKISTVLSVDKNSDSVSGTCSIEASGIDDYKLRNAVKRSSATALKILVQDTVNNMFTGLGVTSCSSSAHEKLNENLKLSATVTGSSWRLVLNSFTVPGIWQAVALPERPRKMILNDGQPSVFESSLEIRGVSFSAAPSEWTQSTSVAESEVYSDCKDGIFTRKIRFVLKKPVIEKEEYNIFRKQINDLLAHASALQAPEEK